MHVLGVARSESGMWALLMMNTSTFDREHSNLTRSGWLKMNTEPNTDSFMIPLCEIQALVSSSHVWTRDLMLFKVQGTSHLQAAFEEFDESELCGFEMCHMSSVVRGTIDKENVAHTISFADVV